MARRAFALGQRVQRASGKQSAMARGHLEVQPEIFKLAPAARPNLGALASIE